jgi:pimeloyl-ACP methyl ester carboxylesterase
VPENANRYAPVNGLSMYYEVHGKGRPLVLLHGALSAIRTSFGPMVDAFARRRQVIAIEQQAHGRTADINRPLTIEQMAEDTAALLHQIGVAQADLFGYSMGSGIALEVAIRYPDLVRKLVFAANAYKVEGLHPGVLDGVQMLQPELLAGSPFEQDYLELAPNPGDWPRLLEKVKALDANLQDTPEGAIRSLRAPVLIIIGDSDIVRPEHAVEMFRLLGGGVAGDNVGLPASQLAVLPGTTHISLASRGEWLVPMIEQFLDKE